MTGNKPKLLVNQKFDMTGLENTKLLFDQCEVIQWPNEVAASYDEILKLVPGVDAIYIGDYCKVDGHLLDKAGPQLKVVCTNSVGYDDYDHIDLEACRKAGVQVGNTPDVLTDTVAELAVTLMLVTARRIHEGLRAVVNGEWGPFKPSWMTGKDILGSTVGIVGLGRIGASVAKRLKAFDINRLVYHSRNKSPHADSLQAEHVDFETLLQVSDFIVICCLYSPETKEMFNMRAFKQMKNDAVLVNISRGGIINQKDLYDALVSGEIWAAGLDVTTPEPLPTDSPLLTLKNCTVLPHIGSATHRTCSKMAELTARNILAALNGQPMPCPLV